MAISRDAIPAVQRARQSVVCSLGEVDVQSMDLGELADFLAARRRASVAAEGEPEEDVQTRAMATLLPMVLAVCVIADDGLPVYDQAQWRVWSAQHMAEAMELYHVAIGLSGGDAEQQKKT